MRLSLPVAAAYVCFLAVRTTLPFFAEARRRSVQVPFLCVVQRALMPLPFAL